MPKRAELEIVEDGTRRRLDEIVHRCESCHVFAQKPCRFKLWLRQDKEFNHTIFFDILYFNGKPILNVVDEGNRYQAA